MKHKGILAGLALLVVVAALAIGADEKAKKTTMPAAGAMDEKAMMEAWAKYATPGESHKKLESFVGSWDTSVKSWMQPGAPPMESKGTSENRMIMGGRFLEQRFTGTMMDMPFEGLGYTGYDNYKKKYVGSWMDNMGTGVVTSLGTADPSGKAMTFTGEMDDPMEGKTKPYKETITMVDNDHHVFEMWSPGPDGKMAKMMEIHYMRKK
jgi:hypothetical protein